MSFNTIYIILNQDRYRYYSYHQYAVDQDAIVCFYDSTGRLADRSDTSDNVVLIQSARDLTLNYVTEQLTNMINSYSAVRVVCTEEKYFLLAAQLREVYGSMGLDFKTSKFFRDKLYMKSKVSDMGFRVPKHCSIYSGLSYADIEKHLRCTEFIIKPISGHGARNTYHIASKRQFNDLDISNPHEYEAEEYIDGELYHIDSVMVNGVILYSQSFEYSYPCIEYKKGKVISSIELDDSSALSEALSRYNLELLSAIGGTHVTHLEVFVKDGDIIFLEIAGRPPGGGLVPLHQITHGIDLANIAMRFQMDPYYVPSIANQHLKYGTYFMVPKPNIKTIKTVSVPLFKSSIEISYINLEAGDSSQVADSVSQNGAFYLVSSERKENVRDDFLMFKTHKMFI